MSLVIRYLRILEHIGDYLMLGDVRFIYEVEHYWHMKQFNQTPQDNNGSEKDQ